MHNAESCGETKKKLEVFDERCYSLIKNSVYGIRNIVDATRNGGDLVIRTSASISVQYDNGFSPFQGKNWKQGFQWVKDAGLDAVEIILSDPDLLNGEEICRELERLDLGVSTISTGQAMGMEGISLCAGSAQIRREARERLLRDVDTAERLGKPNVTIGLIRGKGGLLPMEIEMSHLERELLTIADYAARKDIKLNLEPINRYECKLINSTEEGYRLLERLGWPENVGILYDTFHSNIEDPDMLQAIRQYGCRFSHVHIADSNRHLPGEGHIDFAGVRQTLLEIGYDGYVSLEVLNRPSAEHVAAQMKYAMNPFSCLHSDNRTTHKE